MLDKRRMALLEKLDLAVDKMPVICAVELDLDK